MHGFRTVSGWKFACLFGIVLYGSLATPPTPSSLAQTRPPTSTTLLKASYADLEKGPHTGPVETALVGLEIYARHGNGFILRCDGFLVVPFDLFDLADSKETPNVTITFSPGTDHEQKLVMPRRSRYFLDNQRIYGFTVFRADGYVHSPALRTLLPDTLKPGPDGDTVEVVWSPWDPATRRFGPLQRRRVGLAALPPTDTDEQKQAVEEAARKRPGFVRFAQPVEGVPAGAVVLGPEGLAIGTVPGGSSAGARDGFVSFSVLNEVTNCISPVPTTDGKFQAAHPLKPAQGEVEEKAGEGEDGKKTTAPKSLAIEDEMVSVPGGPLLIPQILLTDQPDMESESVACVAPFQIDKFEVTNQQYKVFWDSTLQHLTDRERADMRAIGLLRQALYPFGWNPDGEPFSPEVASLPVVGVTLAGAKAYAKWAGKRLPTPYEWAKAAFGPKGETQPPAWVTRYILTRREAWADLIRQHDDYLRGHPGLVEALAHVPSRQVDDPNGPPGILDFRGNLRQLPWDLGIAGKVYKLEERVSAMMVQATADRLMEEWKDPLFMLPVGTRTYDVSPYGAMDMLLNANEMYLTNPRTPVFGQMRHIRAEWSQYFLAKSDFYFVNPIDLLFPSAFRLDFLMPQSQVRFSRLYRRTSRVFFEGDTPQPPHIQTPSWNELRVDRRKIGSPPQPYPLNSVIVISNYIDVMSMVVPLQGWRLMLGKDRQTAVAPLYFPEQEGLAGEWHEADFVPPGNGNARPFHVRDYYYFVRYWDKGRDGQPLRYPHRELGRIPAQQGTIITPPEKNNGRTKQEDYDHDLYYILPVGFRCAR